ncbi:hypothetical protein [Chengkuizengella axinellae]|uniref:Tetratricopeptide repeat protein n=1 Tax=Chengkuizengella axinellae TaxID=3064388 RepID=A0ABT9IXW3_9BACL|nr:hypothetical protein [Chengkuizengella sp. 2205SS18-9]MDP5274211.1 hypothetical protein [Chengkuizengella sp. 2205SS18-9]
MKFLYWLLVGGWLLIIYILADIFWESFGWWVLLFFIPLFLLGEFLMNKLFPKREEILSRSVLKRTLKKELKKPLRTFEDYQYLAGLYNMLSQNEEAIRIMEKAIQNKQFTNLL